MNTLKNTKTVKVKNRTINADALTPEQLYRLLKESFASLSTKHLDH